MTFDITHICIFVLGFSIAQLLCEVSELKKIRKAVEMFAEDFSSEVRK